MNRFRWLVDLEIAGNVHRFSTEPLDVETADGETLEYRAGLPSDFEMGQSDPRADVEIVDSSTNWPALSEVLDNMNAEIRRWREGTVFEQAELYARGLASEVEHGAIGESLVFTIEDEGQASSAPMPDAEAVVSAVTAPDADLDAAGTARVGDNGDYYPIVFGTPGLAPDISATPFAVVPCPIRQYPVVVSPGVPTAIEASEIGTVVVSEDPTTCLPATAFVFDAATRVGDEQRALLATDLLGRRIVVTDFLLHFFSMPGSSESWNVLVGYYEGPGIRGLYDVLVYLLRRFAEDTVDWGRLPEIRLFLDGYFVDTWIDDPVGGGVWVWIEDVLLPTLPIAVRTSSRGRYFVPLYFATDPARTTREMVVGEGVTRVDAVSWRGGGVNEFTVKFRDKGDGYAGTIIIAGDRSTDTGTVFSFLSELQINGLCTASRARYGRRPTTVEVAWTWDRSTAGRVGEWMVQRDALPHRQIRYLVPEEWGLRESDQVHLVDDELHLDELAIIEGPPLVGGPSAVVTLRIPGR